MKKFSALGLALALLAGMFFATPGFADDLGNDIGPGPSTPPAVTACQYTYDAELAALKENGVPVVELSSPEDFKAAAHYEGDIDVSKITRAFVASYEGHFVLAVEVDGCLLPAVDLGMAPNPADDNGSGAQKDGSIQS